jgi:uncharacterized membrane protein YgaE (UPF0421/DUF939 family)
VTTSPLPTRRLTRSLRRRIRLFDRLGAGVVRVRVSWWSIGQSALGGAVAWEIAVRLLGHPAPFFAPTAAIVCLSISAVNRMRRVVELALGVTIGVGLGDLLVGTIGRGGWQLGLVVLIAMTIGLLLDGGVLIVNQAALQAVFVAALPPPTGGYVGRWQDALTGSGVALAIAFALPADPRPAIRRTSSGVVQAVAEALRRSASAARSGDAEEAFAALEEARGTQPLLARWKESVLAGEEISRLSPLRRHADPEIAAHRRSLDPIDRAIRNIRVALRRVVAAIEDAAPTQPPAGASTRPSPGAPGTRPTRATGSSAAAEDHEPALPPRVLDRLEDLAGTLCTLPGALRDPDGEGGRRMLAALTELAGRLDPDELGARSMSATVVVAQLQSAVVDLLQVPGLDEQAAKDLLRRT